jgi:hypothetical protein
MSKFVYKKNPPLEPTIWNFRDIVVVNSSSPGDFAVWTWKTDMIECWIFTLGHVY